MWCCSDVSRSLSCDDSFSSFPRRRESMDFALLPVIEMPFALSRESLFFACAKKSNHKKAHPGGAPYALRAAGLLAAPQGPRSSNSNSKRCLQGLIPHTSFLGSGF